MSSNYYEQNPAVAEAFQTLFVNTRKSVRYDDAIDVIRQALPRAAELVQLRAVTDLIERSQSVQIENAEQALMHALLDEPLGFLGQMVDEVFDTGAHASCGDECTHVQARNVVDFYLAKVLDQPTETSPMQTEVRESEAATLRRELLAREGTSSLLRPDLCVIPQETFQKVVSYLARQMRLEAAVQEQQPDV